MSGLANLNGMTNEQIAEALNAANRKFMYVSIPIAAVNLYEEWIIPTTVTD